MSGCRRIHCVANVFDGLNTRITRSFRCHRVRGALRRPSAGFDPRQPAAHTHASTCPSTCPAPPPLLAYPHDHACPCPADGTPVRELRRDLVRRTLLPGMRRTLRRRPVPGVPVVTHRWRQVLPPVRHRSRGLPSVGRARIGHSPMGHRLDRPGRSHRTRRRPEFRPGIQPLHSPPQPEAAAADQPVNGDAPPLPMGTRPLLPVATPTAPSYAPPTSPRCRRVSEPTGCSTG